MAFLLALPAMLAGGAGAATATAAGAAGAGMSAGSLLSGLGTAVSVGGTILSGIAGQNAADFQAAQLDAQAKSERARGQRAAEQETRKADLIMSRQQALAAASGAGASTDAPTIVKIMSDTAEQGAINAGMVNWNANERALGLEAQAEGARMSGQSKMFGSLLSGAGGLFSGLSKIPTFADKYG